MGVLDKELEFTEESYKEYSAGQGEFSLFPDGTKVLAKLVKVVGAKNSSERYYPKMEWEVLAWPATVEGRFGKPRLFDNMTFTIPDFPSKFADQPEEIRAKKIKSFNIWRSNVGDLGLNPANLLQLSEEGVGSFFACAIGTNMIIRVGLEPATEKYKAKNVPKSYYPAKESLLAKYGLVQATTEVPF